MAQASEYSVVIALDVSWRLMCWSGLAVRFASCPPRFALLLDLRKTHSQPALVELISVALKNTLAISTGTAFLPQRSQGGGRRTGDMSGGGYAVTVADLVKKFLSLLKFGCSLNVLH